MKISISGVRGIFGNDFTLREVMKFCNNFSSLIKSKKCVIGNDTRPSSTMISQVASAILLKNGIDVYNLGTAPTPVVFRESRKYGSGLVITSSHNPLEWNGLKFIVEGRGINELELGRVTQDQEVSSDKFGSENFLNSNYINDAANLIGKISSTPEVIIDLGGGAAKTVASTLLEKIGCTVKVINENISDTTRGPDPTSDPLSDLTSQTAPSAIGFAFDLDGDRLVVVKDGKKQAPDVTLGLGVAKSLEMGYKKFVLSTDTSNSIEKFIIKKGGVVKRSKVGEANVIDLMLKTNSQAGGEGSSGGFILPEFNYCRDGILTSGFIASMLGTSSFSEILEFMKNYFQIRDKVEIDSKLHDKIMDEFHDKLKELYSEISTLDGIKVTIDKDSWVLIRKSNTEDIIRISAESTSEEKTKTHLNQIKDLLMKIYEQVK